MRVRLMMGFLMVGLIFLGLFGRLVYLGTNMDRVIAVQGLEMEVFHQYPPLLQTGAAPRPRSVRVPALVGRSFSEAGDSLLGTGLLIEGMGDIRGEVVRQQPAAGRAVPEGTAVRVWLQR